MYPRARECACLTVHCAQLSVILITPVPSIHRVDTRLRHNSDIITANIYLRALSLSLSLSRSLAAAASISKIPNISRGVAVAGVNGAARRARDGNGTGANLFPLDAGKPLARSTREHRRCTRPRSSRVSNFLQGLRSQYALAALQARPLGIKARPE